MSAVLPAPRSDEAFAKAPPLRARLSHRLAQHTRTVPGHLAPPAPMVSFTFDDAPVCACTLGARMLDAHGAKGTFYIAGGLIGTRGPHWQEADDADIAALHAGGHEIGAHTYSHAFVPNLSAEAIRGEAARTRARLNAIVPDLTLESFAFPFGFGSVGAKRVLGTLYRSGRSIMPGLNRGRADLMFLRANPLMDGSTDVGRIERLMDEALSRNGWLIFYGHDVADAPSPYGCTPALLDAALQAAEARGIARVTVREALRRASADSVGSRSGT